MENPNGKRYAPFMMEIIDKLAQIFLEVMSKVNVNKVRVAGSFLINLLY